MPQIRPASLLVLLCTSSLLGSSSTDNAPLPRAVDDRIAKVRRAAADAEVHAIGVAGPAQFRLGAVTDWVRIVNLLRAKKGAAGRVWGMLSKDSQKALSDEKAVAMLDDLSSAGADKIKASVMGDLQRILDDPYLYAEESFKGLLLGEEVKELIALGKKRTGLQRARMNWALLDATFPGCIPELPRHFRTVRVQVLSGADVILVLSSHGQCKWEITLRDGAKVVGVVLAGNGGQEIVGVDAPIVYRDYYAPDGITVVHPDDYFGAYDKNEKERYERFVACVKEITGKDLASFQGEYRPDALSEPYTVRPLANK